MLDGDDSNPIVLNDFYQTALDDFTNGKVNYKFRNLEVGPHTLKIKAWDTYNNSSEATLHFVVLSDTTLHLEHVLNYPNPFVNYTEFWFHHNKPNELLAVQIQIFTILKKIKYRTSSLKRERTSSVFSALKLLPWKEKCIFLEPNKI